MTTGKKIALGVGLLLLIIAIITVVKVRKKKRAQQAALNEDNEAPVAAPITSTPAQAVATIAPQNTGVALNSSIRSTLAAPTTL